MTQGFKILKMGIFAKRWVSLRLSEQHPEIAGPHFHI